MLLIVGVIASESRRSLGLDVERSRKHHGERCPFYGLDLPTSSSSKRNKIKGLDSVEMESSRKTHGRLVAYSTAQRTRAANGRKSLNNCIGNLVTKDQFLQGDTGSIAKLRD